MGLFREGLCDHEGCAARQLPDGTLTGTWTLATDACTGYVGACGCGWQAALVRPPTDEGREQAEDDWRQHADQLEVVQADRRRQQLRTALGVLGGQGDDALLDPAARSQVCRAAERALRLARELLEEGSTGG